MLPSQTISKMVLDSTVEALKECRNDVDTEMVLSDARWESLMKYLDQQHVLRAYNEYSNIKDKLDK